MISLLEIKDYNYHTIIILELFKESTIILKDQHVRVILLPRYYYIGGKDSVTEIRKPYKSFLKSFHSKAIEMKMFDIGGGQVIIIQNQEKAILYDAGVDHSSMIPDLVKKLQSYLKGNHVKLRAIVASHNHEDHVNVIAPLLEDPDVPNSEILREDVQFFHQNEKRKSRFYKKMMNVKMIVTDKKIPKVAIRQWTEKRIKGWGSNQIVKLFCGPQISGEKKRFYRSILMSVTIGKAKFLLTGDIDANPTEEEIIIKEGTKQLLNKVDVLQITHHGSKYGTGYDFLAHVSPALFFTSSDQDDPKHDLSPETEKRIMCYIDNKGKKFDTKYYTIFNTYWHGDIIIRTDGKLGTINGVKGILFEVELEKPIGG